ncbi:MAG: hypothetical protein WA777_15695 [Rhodanobacter sp.]
MSQSYADRRHAAFDADEALKRYALATKYGTYGDICVATMTLSDLYAKADDKANWKKWDRQSRADCMPDTLHWVKRDTPDFPMYDDSPISRDPKLKNEAAEYLEYLSIGAAGARDWQEGDASGSTSEYQRDLSGGTLDSRCTDAFTAADEYLEALDETNYAKWKALQKTDCKAAGDDVATRAVSSGADADNSSN